MSNYIELKEKLFLTLFQGVNTNTHVSTQYTLHCTLQALALGFQYTVQGLNPFTLNNSN